MRCVYNGVDLGVIETHYFNWESVYDDTATDYLYSKVSFACRALVNGIASVHRLDNGPFVNYGFASQSSGGTDTLSARTAVPFVPRPTATNTEALDRVPLSRLRAIVRDPAAGGNPNSTAVSHQAVRYRLSVPRRPLYVFWGDANPVHASPSVLFLQSPLEQYATDCKNGPTPRLLSVVEALGDANTLMVDWACETYINENQLNDVNQTRALVSNRFSQTHAVGQDGYTTVTTEGVAVFRTDLTYRLGESPDDSRNVLFMPIPRGFVREILYCRGRADVTGVEYGYADKQVSVNFVAGPYVKAAEISCVHQQAVTTDIDVFGTALGTYERALSIAANRNFAFPEAAGKPKAPAPAPAPRGLRRLGGGLARPVPPPAGP